MKFLSFHNSGDDSYMNSIDNFRGMDVGTEFIDIYFQAATSGSLASGYDYVRLEILAGKEEIVLDFLGRLIANTRDAVTVVRDDANSTGCHANIEAITSINIATKGSVEPPAIITTVDRTMTTAESGSTVLVNHAARVITLPSANLIAGMNFTVVPLIDPDTGWTVVAAAGIYGHITVISSNDDDDDMMAEQSVLRSACVAAPGDFDNFDLLHSSATLGGLAGQKFKFLYDGTAWLLEDCTVYSDHADPASIAIINGG